MSTEYHEIFSTRELNKKIADIKENIHKHQQIHQTRLEIIFFAIVGSFLINLLSSSIFEINIKDLLSFSNIYVKYFYFSLCSLIILVIYVYSTISMYKPLNPMLDFYFNIRDLEPFINFPFFPAFLEYLQLLNNKHIKIEDISEVYNSTREELFRTLQPLKLPFVEKIKYKTYRDTSWGGKIISFDIKFKKINMELYFNIIPDIYPLFGTDPPYISTFDYHMKFIFSSPHRPEMDEYIDLIATYFNRYMGSIMEALFRPIRDYFDTHVKNK